MTTETSSAYHYDTSVSGIAATRTTASVVVPLIMAIFKPRSVVDAGCGLGDWLAEFQRQGCEKVLGMDGNWVPSAHLQISPDDFKTVDLNADLPVIPKFDLAMSLEVAEHINEPAGKRLVSYLASAADVVLFSAAIPEQGGYRHINEHYQSYWIEEFSKHGFSVYDLIRPTIWGNEACNWWYQQNLLVFASKDAALRFNLTQGPFIADVVHPTLFEWHKKSSNWGSRPIIRALLSKILRRLGVKNGE